MKENRVKVAVTGAAGQIGYALLFRIAAGEMFGPGTKVILSLLELPQAIDAAKGVVMELQDCAFPLLENIEVSDSPEVAFADADWALLVGSVPRKKGMERKDLIKINSQIFIEQGKALSQTARKTCKVLVVGNPCNTNAFIAKETARNIDPRNFFALTMLDQNRAYAQIVQKTKVPLTAIEGLVIWGNHSATQFPDFYNATIKGRPLIDAVADEEWLQKDFIQKVQQRGAAIIHARGLSSAASAANAVINTVQKLLNPTASAERFSLAVVSDGSYGIEKGLIFSFPVRSNGKDWEIVSDLPLNEFSQKKIKESEQELLQERAAIKSLLEK